MAARWSAEEHNTLVSLLVDGVSIQSLCNALPTKTEGAIVTRARNKKLGLDFRTSRIDGKLYSGVKRRTKTKKTALNTRKEDTTIIGAKKVTTNNSAPTTSERTNQNFSDESIAQNGNREAYIAIYENFSTLIESENYSSVEVSAVISDGTAITISKNNV